MANPAYRQTNRAADKTARILDFCQTELNDEAQALAAELIEHIVRTRVMGQKSAEELAALLIYKTGGDILDWVKTWQK